MMKDLLAFLSDIPPLIGVCMIITMRLVYVNILYKT